MAQILDFIFFNLIQFQFNLILMDLTISIHGGQYGVVPGEPHILKSWELSEIIFQLFEGTVSYQNIKLSPLDPQQIRNYLEASFNTFIQGKGTPKYQYRSMRIIMNRKMCTLYRVHPYIISISYQFSLCVMQIWWMVRVMAFNKEKVSFMRFAKLYLYSRQQASIMTFSATS